MYETGRDLERGAGTLDILGRFFPGSKGTHVPSLGLMIWGSVQDSRAQLSRLCTAQIQGALFTWILLTA